MTGVLVVALVWLLLAAQLGRRAADPRRALAAAHALARTVDLALAGPTESAVVARCRARDRAAAIGMAVGVVVAAAALLATRPDQIVLPVIVTALAGGIGAAAGQGFVAWKESGVTVPPEEVRIARTSTPDVADYVAPLERGSAAVAAAAPAGALLALGASTRLGGDLPGMPWAPAVVLACLPVVLLVLAQVAGRRLVARPQPARTTLELAWDDALRARALRDLVGVVVAGGAGLAFVAIWLASGRADGGWPANVAVGVTSGLTIALSTALAVGALAGLVVRPERHVRRALWPASASAGGAA
ncbi:hypothetical protein N866_09010 [Actinotalea ferrariae CF5-4]|uniref:Uncharacterized protein n=1 Tax=Actinotalea ferrariae CF5-4 TaxID=948458 RepID=A0A021VTJ5_9CELL|nr:hypothetical protein [Actinotalea ferrariae]EYR62382.1 hypothetical protein N866_09010 [Actinotalea ferrariae CF5-4]